MTRHTEVPQRDTKQLQRHRTATKTYKTTTETQIYYKETYNDHRH